VIQSTSTDSAVAGTSTDDTVTYVPYSQYLKQTTQYTLIFQLLRLSEII